MGEFTSIAGFTAIGAIDFSNQAMTNVKINSGSIHDTSVDVSGSTFTTSATQKLAILEGAGSDVSFGDYKISATMGEFTSIAGFTAIGAIDFSNQAMTNVKINSGSIHDTSVDVSGSTFTTSATQKLAILEGAGSDVHFGDYKISATMSEFTSIAGGNAVFTSIAEKLNTVGSESSNTIDYNDGSVVYLTLSGARPYTYDIINVPDLNAQTHVITVITKSSDINTDDYATSVTINGSSYDLIWNAGSLPELDTVVNDIITQQFSILPLDLVSSPGKVLTNVSYYKSAT